MGIEFEITKIYGAVPEPMHYFEPGTELIMYLYLLHCKTATDSEWLCNNIFFFIKPRYCYVAISLTQLGYYKNYKKNY